MNGKIWESEEEDTLLLKVVQSVEERYPLVVELAWEIESVEPEKLSGPETVAVSKLPVPLPTRRPVSVVEPVPPLGTVKAEPNVSEPPMVALPDVCNVPAAEFTTPTPRPPVK